MDKLTELKRKYLIDETTGLIREGITDMSDYAKIFYAKSEEELDSIILEIMESRPNDEIKELQDEEE